MSRATLLMIALLLTASPSWADDGPLPLGDGMKARLGSTRYRNGTDITTVALSPDARQIATSGVDQVVRLWDARTGNVVATADSTLGPIHVLVYSPDGKSLAAVSHYRGIRVLDTSNGRLRWSMHQNGGNNCVAWTPDGKMLAAGSRDGVIRFIDHANGKMVQITTRHTGIVNGVHFTPDGKELLSVGTDNKLRLWSVTEGVQLRERTLAEAKTESLPSSAVAFSPDGKLVAINQPGGARTWTTDAKSETRLVGDAADKAGPIAFAADGQLLGLVSSGSFFLRKIADKPMFSLVEKRRPVTAFALSADGKTLVVSRAAVLEVWDITTGKRHQTDDLPNAAVPHLAFVNGGKTVVSLDVAGGLHAWDVDKGTLIDTHRFRCNPDAGLGQLADGKTVRTQTQTVRGWLDWQPGGRAEGIPSNDSFIPPLSPDGRLFVRADTPTSAALFDAATGQIVRKLLRPPTSSTLYFSEDSKRFAGLSTEGQLHVWDIATGQASAPLSGPRSSYQCYLSPGGRTVVQLSAGVRVWETVSGGERSRYRFNRIMTAATFSPDGRTLIVGTSRGEVIGLDLDSGKELTVRVGHNGAVRSLRFSPDGKLLGSGGDDTTIVVWDALHFRGPRLAAQELGEQKLRTWDELAIEDAERAFQAIQFLSNAGAEAVPLIRAQLRPVKEDTGKKIKRLVEMLDDKRFAKREAAMRELTEIGPEAAPALQQLLDKNPALDLRNRVEELLKRFRTMTPESRLRGVRAVEVLERIATAAARDVLKELAAGDAEAWLTREAKAALERLR